MYARVRVELHQPSIGPFQVWTLVGFGSLGRKDKVCVVGGGKRRENMRERESPHNQNIPRTHARTHSLTLGGHVWSGSGETRDETRCQREAGAIAMIMTRAEERKRLRKQKEKNK